MNATTEILDKIICEFKIQGYSQVPGYNRFGYIRDTGNSLIVSREKGENTKIPFPKIAQAIEAVKDNPSVYNSGPSSLRSYGVTYINSPIWSLLHLVPLSDY